MDPPDFLFPNVDEFGIVQPLEAMSYPRALRLLRWCATLPWKQNQPALPAVNLTLRSLKTTMLSWGIQIADKAQISLEERQTQGHHRLHGASPSVKLYSRDDVFSQLSFREKLVVGVQNGFCFAILRHRGGQQPLREPEVGSLEAYTKELPIHGRKFFVSQRMQQVKELLILMQAPSNQQLNRWTARPHLPQTSGILKALVTNQNQNGLERIFPMIMAQ